MNVIESIGIGRAGATFSNLLRRAEGGVRFVLLRFDEPAAAIISYTDFLRLGELERRDALAMALLRGKGYAPDLGTEQFIDVLSRVRQEASNGNG